MGDRPCSRKREPAVVPIAIQISDAFPLHHALWPVDGDPKNASEHICRQLNASSRVENVTRQLETWSKTFQDLPSLSDASEPQYVPIRIVQGKYIFGELHLFYDELEWDLSSAKIEAEVYAMRMANDFGLGPEMAAAIATEFKKQVEKASKAVSSGDLLPSRSPAKGYNESRRRNACPIVLRGDEAKQLITEKRKRKAGNASSVEQKGANNPTESSIGLADDRKLPSEGS